MTDLERAARQALEVLNQLQNSMYINDYGDWALWAKYDGHRIDEAITALRQALGEQK